MSPATSCRRLTVIVATTLAAVAATVSPAVASGVSGGCPAAATSNPFTAWGDGADYQLVPAGDFEDGASSWSLFGGAATVAGNRTSDGSSGRLSLSLPGVSSATSARMCIGPEHPTYRFFVKRSGGSAAGRLLAEVVYTDSAGRDVAVTAGHVSAAEAWAPSPVLPTVVSELASEQGNAIDVSFRFTPYGGGVWSIDDLYVDPLRGRF